ncbi:MAG: tol-pal system protein YbgF [Alphaproteobacteria bacterium]
MINFKIENGARRMAMAAVLAAGVLLNGGAPQAYAQSESGGAVMMDSFVLDQLYARLNRLERDMQGLVRTGQVPAGGGNYGIAPDAAVADLNIKLTTLEEELAAVTGQLETIQHGLSRVLERVDLLQKDVEFRLSAIEKAGGAVAASGKPVATSPASEQTTAKVAGQSSSMGPQAGIADQPGQPTSTLGSGLGANLSVDGRGSSAPSEQKFQLPAGDPAEKYNYAVGLLRQGSYADAETAFRAFVDEHPTDGLASNAQYWLGESHYVRNMYKEAASAFLSGLKSYPDGNKAPQSMLKLGMTLAQLGHMQQACVTLGELEARYPTAPAKVRARAVRERSKAGCG